MCQHTHTHTQGDEFIRLASRDSHEGRRSREILREVIATADGGAASGTEAASGTAEDGARREVAQGEGGREWPRVVSHAPRVLDSGPLDGGDSPVNSGSSVDELEVLGEAVVLYNFEPSPAEISNDQEKDLLRLRVNDIVTILRKENDGWWLGILQDEVGWFPEKFCAEIGSQSLSDLPGDAARRPA